MKFKQRPILFRFWCVGCSPPRFMFSRGINNWSQYINNPFYVPQQFTGLKDKYGKKIFEGDIVKILSWDKAEDDEPADSFFIDVVCFKNANFTLQKESHYTLSEWNKPRKFKIIGNIFENPELLK